MPEELPGLLRGGVSWGLGTLFAGQGDNRDHRDHRPRLCNVQAVRLSTSTSGPRSTSRRGSSATVGFVSRSSIFISIMVLC